MDSPKTPNAESIAYWNEDAGPRWARRAEAIDVQLEPFLGAIATRSGVSAGDHVLDVGCGAGALSLHLADRVAATGRVVGVDISDNLLEVARQRAGDPNRDVLGFRRGDAQVEPFEPASFDRVVSRFGVMFFDDSVRAFENLRRALRPSGTMTFACWAAPDDNPWMGLPQEVVARHLEPTEPPDPDQPGPFRFSDPEFVRTLCVEAGFEAVAVDSLRGDLVLGGRGSLDEALDFMLEVGPAARASEADEETRGALVEDLRRTLEPFAGERGIEMPYGAWLVHAVAAR